MNTVRLDKYLIAAEKLYGVFPLGFWKGLENSMTFWKSNIKNCSFGCFFYAPMVENWMTEMLEN